MTPAEMAITALAMAVVKSVGLVCIVAMFAATVRGCYRAGQEALNRCARDIK